MEAIAVRVGREEKEISGLTRRTTCSDLVLALLKNKQPVAFLSAENDNLLVNDFDICNMNAKELRDLSQSYVIVENWRGCEKPLLPQTRILAVWQSWGKEQCHVKFSLKKDKNIHFNVRKENNKNECPHRYNKLMNMKNPSRYPQQQSDSAHFLHKLSYGQKKRIRRSIMQYQRAVLSQHTKEHIDNNNNSDKPLFRTNSGKPMDNSAENHILPSSQKTSDLNEVTLSEEQFVDGVVTGPDCILRHDGKSNFIRNALDNNKEFNKEHCRYRRPHHRRRSLILDDSDGQSDQNVVLYPLHKQEFHHYPYCRKSRRRSSSSQRRQASRKHGRISKSRKHGKHSSADSTTTSNGTPSAASGTDDEFLSEAEDADDEKSILTEFAASVSRQKLRSYPVDRYSSGNVSASTTTTTDSSSGTTTCSETSNISSFSGTSSSETSSSPDIYTESFFAKRAAAAAAAAKPANQEKSKTGIGATKLFRKVVGPTTVSKPANSVLSSFKNKKKRKAPPPPIPSLNSSSSLKTFNNTNCTKAAGSVTAKPTTPPVPVGKDLNAKNKDQTSNIAELGPFTLSTTSSCGKISYAEKRSSPKTVLKEAAESNDDGESKNTLEQLMQLVIAQDKEFRTKANKVNLIDDEVEKIESQVHRWRTQTHGKNYVQDTYLSGLGESGKNNADSGVPKPRTRQFSSSTFSPEWVTECDDQKALSDYVKACERIVDMQMRIEECKRKTEIVVQDMQDEVWRASGDPCTTSQTNALSAAALGLVSNDCDTNSGDEEDSRFESLSVSNSKTKNIPPSSTSDALKENHDTSESTLEIECSRTELEANLYLSLRLSTELEEVNERMSASQRLLQSKGETLLNLVRELAESPEGISPELWDEYGELLAAYDAEVSVKRYLASCPDCDDSNPTQSDGCIKSEGKKIPMAMVYGMDGLEPTSPAPKTLNHALAPWMWCEHCKDELHHLQQQRHRLPSVDTPPTSPHILSRSAVTTNFSDLPLPPLSPLIRSKASATALLPMPPIPDCNDSDYDEITEKGIAITNASAIISTKGAAPRSIVYRNPPARRQDKSSSINNSNQIDELLSSARTNSSSTTDDSGNASIASTSSDTASIDTVSRNSSCDGGSPRPPSVSTESQDSAQSSPCFQAAKLKRNNSKTRFVFPPQQKLSQDDASKLYSKNTQNRRIFPYKPSIPNRPGTITSAPVTPADFFSLPSSPAIDEDRLEQQKKLIRRNSGRTKKTAPPIPQFQEASICSKQDTHNNVTGILKKLEEKSETDKRLRLLNYKNNHLRNCPSPLDLLPTAKVAPSRFRSPLSAPCSPYVGSNLNKIRRQDPRRSNMHLIAEELKKLNRNRSKSTSNAYDNDSDTGLSSLHSSESVDKLALCSETLV